MPAYNKVFFHAGPVCSCTGIGALFSELDKANIAFGHKTADEYGTAWEASQYANATTVWRLTTKGQNDGQDYDVPDYNLAPADAALKHWLITKAKLPPEFNKNTWIEPINEVDKNRADWLGYFALAIANMANSEGYKVSLFAFSAGEPEADDWETPGMLAYLEYCADHPNEAAVSLHEYSLTKADLFEGFPYLVGRFQFLHDVCDDHGIARPTIFISEFGWEYQNVPDVPQAMTEIGQAAELYAAHPNIRFAAVWYLGGGSNWPNIGQQTQKLIEPIKNYTLTAEFPDPPEEPQQPPDGEEPPMTTYKNLGDSSTKRLPGATHVRVAFRRRQKVDNANVNLNWGGQSDLIQLPAGTDVNDLMLVQFKEIPDEPANPNPPPVVFNPLPQGALFADVSANNKVVNLAALKAKGVQGIGIRLSNGIRKNTDTTDANGVDKMAQYYIEEAESLDMAWLGYHFSNEHYDDVEQVRHFLGIANQFIAAGHIPEMGLWLDFETPQPPVQGSPTSEDRIELQLAVLATERPSFIGDYGPYTSKGWWDNKVPNAAAWVPALGLKSWAAAWVPTGTLVNGWPPSWWHPAKLKGFTDTHFWQWTSAGGLLVGHSVASLDLNFVGGTAVVPGSQPPPPPPPTGKTVDFISYLMPAFGNIGPFLVFEKAAGGNIDHQVQVQNGIVYVVKRAAVGTEYEELRVSGGFIERRYDTSPADGLPYKLDDGYGWSKWMPSTMTEGQYFKRSPRVTKYDVANNCEMVADQGVSESYIYFAKFHESYTLPGGVVKTAVCELHWLWVPGGVVLEKYFLAPGIFYIMWGNGDALHYLNEEPQGREPLPLSPVGCLV